MKRKAYHIGAGAADGTHQKAALSLDTIGPCFIQRFAGLDIGGEDGITALSKADLSGLAQALATVSLDTTQAQAGDDLVFLPLQATEDLQGMACIIGLAKNTAFQGDHRIGANNPGAGVLPGNQLGLFPGHPVGKGSGQFFIQGCLINISDLARKAETEVNEKLLPPGDAEARIRGLQVWNIENLQ